MKNEKTIEKKKEKTIEELQQEIKDIQCKGEEFSKIIKEKKVKLDEEYERELEKIEKIKIKILKKKVWR